MYFWIVKCSLAFLLCVLGAGIVIPQILLIAFRKKLFDFPDERKVHHCAVPRLGGIAFKPVVFFTIALLLGINMVLGHSEILSEIGNDVCSLAFAFCSIMVLCWKNEKPNPKNRLLQPDPAHSLRVSSGEVPALFHRGCLPSPVPDTR